LKGKEGAIHQFNCPAPRETMAGHNNNNNAGPGSGSGAGSGSGSGAGAGTGSSSGYIANLWQALFASLIQLLSRIFRSKSGDTSSKQSPSHPPAEPAPATPPHPDASASDANHQPAIVITDTDASAAPTTTDIDTTAANAAPSQQGQYHNSSDLEKGDPSLDEAMAAAKKRGGQKRAAAKLANGSNQAANNIVAAPQQPNKENVVPGKLPAQPAASAPLSKPSSTATPLSSRDDNRANIKQQQHQLPVTHALDDVSAPGKPRDRQPLTKELDTDTNNHVSSAPVATTITPSTNAREAPKPTSSQAPPSTAVVPTTNQSEIQSSGSHSADGAQNADPSNLPTTQRVPPNNANMDQATTTLEALAVSDKPSSQPDLDKDTAAIAAAAVPLVVTVPGLKQPIVPKPLAPLVTPPSQVLPGLIEPTTEEGKIERAHHLKFMREALAMVSASPVPCLSICCHLYS
jgi:hypothetical protein